MDRYNVAVIPGDGIGNEVMPPSLAVLRTLADKYGFGIDLTHFDWGCERYRRTGEMMPHDGLLQLSQHDAILLGAVGAPGVPDHISLWGLLIPIRQQFEQYVSLRPIRLLNGISSPLRHEQPINIWIVRENTEGEYSQVGGRFGVGTASEQVVQSAVFTRQGVDRILRYAFDLARETGLNHVTSATKSNGIY